MNLDQLFSKLKGGSGSGNFGHGGRPGKRGGSSVGGGGSREWQSTENIVAEAGMHPIVEDLYKSYEKSFDDWTRGADPDAKISIQEHLHDKSVREVSLRKLHNSTGRRNQSFEEFMDKPITVYRGGRPEFGETFSNFTLSKSTAEDFAKKAGTGLYEAKIKPSEILGFAATGATEIFIQPEGFRGVDLPRISRID